MSVSVPGPAQYNYVCTRLRIRRGALFTRLDYMRMLNMSIPQIVRLVGEHGYGKEYEKVDLLCGCLSGYRDPGISTWMVNETNED